MRIVGGQARGRTLRLPKGCRIRPTADRVKESLFDILQPLEGECFLDLFAGCGSVGLEALSRGARFAGFVEKQKRLADAICTNLRLLEYEERAEVVPADAGVGVRHFVQRGRRFDILFADPPYDEGFIPLIVDWLKGGELLTESGIAVLQHSVRETLEGTLGERAVLADQRHYGDTVLSFLKIKGQKESRL